jgi:hypothetical protein
MKAICLFELGDKYHYLAIGADGNDSRCPALYEPREIYLNSELITDNIFKLPLCPKCFTLPVIIRLKNEIVAVSIFENPVKTKARRNKVRQNGTPPLGR